MSHRPMLLPLSLVIETYNAPLSPLLAHLGYHFLACPAGKKYIQIIFSNIKKDVHIVLVVIETYNAGLSGPLVG